MPCRCAGRADQAAESAVARPSDVRTQPHACSARRSIEKPTLGEPPSVCDHAGCVWLGDRGGERCQATALMGKPTTYPETPQESPLLACVYSSARDCWLAHPGVPLGDSSRWWPALTRTRAHLEGPRPRQAPGLEAGAAQTGLICSPPPQS